MRLFFDLPDNEEMKTRGVLPLDCPEAVGYLLVVVNKIDNKMVMQYNVGRDSTENVPADEHQQYLDTMEYLESIARTCTDTYNRVKYAAQK